MNATDVFITLTELAQELGVGCATIRRRAGRADVARLRAMLAATVTTRALALVPA